MFKCRASGVGQIMTDPRSESEVLSETCKKYLQAQWIADTYKREKDFTSLAIQKGLANEEQGITMLAEHYGEMLTKNDKWFHDDYFTGTPDILREISVPDVKCSYSIWTFAASDGTDKGYYYQLQTYMHLTGLKKAELVYVLTDTPEAIIQAELKRITWQLQDDSDALEIEAGLRKQMTYSDIPQEDRIKIFEFDYEPEVIEKMITRVELCREYYNNLTL